jgi:hypothetical protein
MPYLTRQRELGISRTRAMLSPDQYDRLLQHGRSLPQPEAVAIGLDTEGHAISGA